MVTVRHNDGALYCFHSNPELKLLLFFSGGWRVVLAGDGARCVWRGEVGGGREGGLGVVWYCTEKKTSLDIPNRLNTWWTVSSLYSMTGQIVDCGLVLAGDWKGHSSWCLGFIPPPPPTPPPPLFATISTNLGSSGKKVSQAQQCFYCWRYLFSFCLFAFLFVWFCFVVLLLLLGFCLFVC